MAKFSDQELLLLCKLLYMEPETIKGEDGSRILSPFTVNWNKCNGKLMTVGDILNSINTAVLRNNEYLREHHFNGKISGAEWADMIDAMKQSELCSLIIKDICIDNKNSLTVCFSDQDGNAYVVFRGTDAGEWGDNFAGGFEYDTEQQKRALDYINGIDADNITVAGLSKGGNKAKYAAILSDKVARCVSFDGQGFSQFFLKKYQDLIEENKYKITCYALDEDFVSIHLYDIYQTKIYVNGYGVGSFEITQQAGYISKLHSFVNYVSATAPEVSRKSMFNFIGILAAMNLGKMPPDYKNKYSQEDMIAFMLSERNAEDLGLLLAFAVKYEEYDHGITDAIIEIINKSGFGLITHWFKMLEKYINTENVLKYILYNHEVVIRSLKLEGAPAYITNFIDKAAASYFRMKYTIKSASSSNTAEYDAANTDIIRDYSVQVREMLLGLTESTVNEKPYDITKWDIWYRMEDWFGLLNINNYQKNIDDYYQKVIDINGTSHQQLLKIFENVDLVLQNYRAKMEQETQRLRTLNGKIRELFTADINSAC